MHWYTMAIIVFIDVNECDASPCQNGKKLTLITQPQSIQQRTDSYIQPASLRN